MTKKLVWFTVAVMSTLLGLGILWQFRTVVVIFLASLALAAAVRPFAQRWARQGFFLRLALTFLFVLALGSFFLLIAQSAGAAIREIRQLANTVAVQDEWMLPDWVQNSLKQQPLTIPVPPPSQLFAALIGDEGQLVLPAILGFTRGILGLVSGSFVVLFMSLYWSLNQAHFERLWLSLLPPAQRSQTRTIWHKIEADLGTYIRSQVIQSLLAGLVLGLGYWILGSPYPVLLALTGALAYLIPMVGVGVALILPLILGLLTSLQLSLLTVLYTLFVLIAIEVWAKPRLFNHRQHNPILTVAILIALANAVGFIGIVIAPAISAAVQILWSHLVVYRAVSGSTLEIIDLQKRYALLSDTIQSMSKPIPTLVTSSMERLTRLMEKAEPLLRKDEQVEASYPAQLTPAFNLEERALQLPQEQDSFSKG
jgi:putative permease